MAPQRARALRYSHQYIHCGSDNSLVQWQARGDFKLRLVARALPRRSLPAGKRHDMVLIVVAEERKSSVCHFLCPDPLISLRQWNKSFRLCHRPPQAQTGERTFQTMSDGERAAVVACEHRRVDAEGEGVFVV